MAEWHQHVGLGNELSKVACSENLKKFAKLPNVTQTQK